MAGTFLEAASRGDVPALSACLERGQPPDTASGSSGDSALLLAAGSGSSAAVRLLLRAGARADARNHSRETALHRAAHANAAEVADLLLKAGADCESADIRGQLPADVARARGLVASDAAPRGILYCI